MRKHATLDMILDFLPNWAPKNLSMYIAHVTFKLSMRDIAGQLNAHPSTVSRNLKAIERKCDDPLFKLGLDRVAQAIEETVLEPCPTNVTKKSLPSRSERILQADNYHLECAQLFTELQNKKSCVLVSLDLKIAALSKNVSVNEAGETKAVDPMLVEILALQSVLRLKRLKHVLSYSLNSTAERGVKKREGIFGLKRQYRTSRRLSLESHAHALRSSDPSETYAIENTVRYNAFASETPLAVLARLRDKSGAMFLSQEQIRAGQRLREDFELVRVISTAHRDMPSTHESSGSMQSILTEDPRKRLDNALNFIGPMLGEIAVRCCCQQQGMEQIEKELAWSARSGKIVLRIALAQLAEFYSNANITYPAHNKKASATFAKQAIYG